MFPLSNVGNNHFFLNNNNELRFFDDDVLLHHIFWQEEVMFTSDEVGNRVNNNAVADDVREEEVEENLSQMKKKKKERKGSKDSEVSAPPQPRRRTGKKDRHSKIRTAQGLRDRRIRLSVQVSRRFFDLHDMLGFDKASKTLDWLFLKSKEAIKDLSKGFRRSSSERIVHQVNDIGGGGGSDSSGKTLSSTSGSDVISNGTEDDGSENIPSTGKGASTSLPRKRNRRKPCEQDIDLVKIRDSRVKARARARERTREKRMGKGPGQDTAPDIGEPNINQETRFLGHSTQGQMMQIYDDHLMDSPRLLERFLGITSTDMFGPNSNNLCEMIRGTEFFAGTLHGDQLGYDSTTHQHQNHNANFIPMSTSEPNPNLLIHPSRSIKEQKQHYP